MLGGCRHGPDPRSFDPVVLGNRETDAWAAYYRHEWRRFLVAAVGMVSTGFGMGPWKTLVGAFHVLRANQLWAPYPDNDPDGARASMRRFYALVASRPATWTSIPCGPASSRSSGGGCTGRTSTTVDVAESALVQALVDLYSYVDRRPEPMRPAAAERVRAMDLSDAWVAAGCDPADPLLAEERGALVASYTALRAAVSRP